MNLQLNAQAELQAVKVLQVRAAAYLVMVFGSYAKGLARSDSDVDIAFAGHEKLDPYALFMLGQKAQIIAFGRIVYCSDEKKRQYLFMRALGDYAKLNEERAVVVNSIARRGSVYAILPYRIIRR